MANSAVLSKFEGNKPRSPLFAMSFTVTMDTYATGGVLIEALLEAITDFKAKNIDLANVVGGCVNLKPDAVGVLYTADYWRATNAIVLKIPAAGPVLEEVAAGAIGATVIAELTLFLG